MDIEALDRLYSDYGFTVNEAFKNKDVRAYQFRHGYFSDIIELVPLKNVSEETKKRAVQYFEQVGYSVKWLEVNDITGINEKLFNGFFQIEDVRKKLKLDYKEFRDRETKKLFNVPYEYINCDFFDGENYCSNGLIEKICKQIFEPGPQLIILEAAAGFGKTCTSFEIIDYLLTNFKKDNVPLFIELSKHRLARLFRYVLADEIDRKFPTLESKTAKREIRNGRIPLLIDGFDELLSKTEENNEDEQESENAQTMLNTIAELFTENSNAKILITARKSSIFANEEFSRWLEQQLEKCDILKIALDVPKAENWLGKDRVKILERKNIPLIGISNPILLSYLRVIELAEFEKQSDDVDKIVEEYFNKLLVREQERQQLQMKVDEQLNLMQKLAANMVKYNFTAETIPLIKEFIEDILKDEINEILSRYINTELRPDKDTLISTLSHHALLDRVDEKNRIGFINEFIFGTLIGEAMIKKILDPNDFTANNIDTVSTAYSIRSKRFREQITALLTNKMKILNSNQRLYFDLKLNKTLTCNYSEIYFDNIHFYNDFDSGVEYEFSNCIFMNCKFDHCRLHTKSFSGCFFKKCLIDEANIVIDSGVARNNNFADCLNFDEFQSGCQREEPQKNDGLIYEKRVLEQYFKKGRAYSDNKKEYRTLIKGFKTTELPKIDEAVQALIEKELIYKQGATYILNTKRMNEIRHILER